MMASLGVGMITGLFDLKDELSERFPDVQPTKMREFIEKHWRGR